MARYSASKSKFHQEEKPDQFVGYRTTSYTPLNSVILGSFSNPPIYVIHQLDTHLTFLQSFQICSLFGRVHIHGLNIQPLTFYSVYNYRTNSLLSVEFNPTLSSTVRSSDEIQSLIPNAQLTELALTNVQQKGGDILLIRQESTNDSLFVRNIREHRLYSQWFRENYSFFENDSWRRLEKDLQIRLIETNNQTVIVSREEFIQTTDHVIDRWLNETTEDFPFVVLICGEKDMGKSTFTRYLVNRALNHVNLNYDLTYFDCDLGQCEFTIGGCLSSVNVQTPLFGPPCSHIKSNPKPDRLLYYGFVSPQPLPVRYLQSINKLRQLWNNDKKANAPKRSMVIINTMGWGTGLGLELLKETICMCCPNMIIQIGDCSNTSQSSDKMPDVTLKWLLEQPVFLPYRRQIEMSNQRQDDYDGQLNYEYLKIQSAAVSSSSSSKSPKLRPRDHRLLAMWSYFFSSKLHRFRLSWSDLIHISYSENSRELPRPLEHAIVAFCISENLAEVKKAARNINRIDHISNYQEEIFECLGFGWIERCDHQTQTYEIYTPIDNLANTNILVSGAFDKPEEFEYIFKRIVIE